MRKSGIFFGMLAGICLVYSINIFSQGTSSKIAHQGIYLNLNYSKYSNPCITEYYGKKRISIEESYALPQFGAGVELYNERLGISMGIDYGSFGIKDMSIGSEELYNYENYSDISFSILNFKISLCYILSKTMPLGISVHANVTGTFDSYTRSQANNFFGMGNSKVKNSYGTGGFGLGLKYFIKRNLACNLDYSWIAGEASQELGFRYTSENWGYYYPIGYGKYTWSNLFSIGISYTIPVSIFPNW